VLYAKWLSINNVRDKQQKALKTFFKQIGFEIWLVLQV